MNTVLEFHAKAPPATASKGLAQGPNVATRVEFEPKTIRTKSDKSTNEPHKQACSQDFASMGNQFFCWGTCQFSFPSLETVILGRLHKFLFEILHCRFTNWFLVNTASIVA